MARFARASLVIALILGCSSAPQEFDGIGPWHVGKTTLKDGVRCQPLDDDPEVTWCFLNPTFTFAKQKANVDLYFRGKDQTTPLSELLMAIDNCDVQVLDSALTERLGAAQKQQGKAFVWEQKTATIVAELPRDGRSCELHFLAKSETKRLSEILARHE